MNNLLKHGGWAAFLAMGLLLVAACNREGDKNVKLPTACFVADKTDVFVGEPVIFTNCSENADHYEWDFGDSTYSNAEDVVKAFAVAGNYLVKLRAFDAKEKYVSSASTLITVREGTKNPPQACFSAPDTVEINDRVLFLNCSEYALRYEWDFGDGGTSTALNPYHSYPQEGTYQVKLTAYGVGETSDDTVRTIVVKRPIHYYITKLVLTKFPATKPGFTTWDPVTGGVLNITPDIFVRFKAQASAQTHTTPVKQNVFSSTVTWNVNGSIELTAGVWSFEVVDDDAQDGGGEELMGSMVADVLSIANNGVATLSSSDGSVELEVHFVQQ